MSKNRTLSDEVLAIGSLWSIEKDGQLSLVVIKRITSAAVVCTGMKKRIAGVWEPDAFTYNRQYFSNHAKPGTGDVHGRIKGFIQQGNYAAAGKLADTTDTIARDHPDVLAHAMAEIELAKNINMAVADSDLVGGF